jgi:hypothetical protein
MSFRLEVTAEAERDADAILEWLFSRHAGETGLRCFAALEDAIQSLAEFPSDVRWPQRIKCSPSKYATCFMVTKRTCIGFSSLIEAPAKYGMVAAGPPSNDSVPVLRPSVVQ